MTDQLIIGDKASFDDFGASVAERSIGQPTKKEVKETVPFSNATYDFSMINGELYWNERKLEYLFELFGDTPQELEEKKITFASWIMTVFNAELHDPYIEDYHFIATFSDLTFDDDESIEKTTAKVIFTAYPYKVSNNPKIVEISVSEGDTATLNVINNSSHRILPLLSFDGRVSIAFNGNTHSATAGTFKSETFRLAVGVNTFTVTNIDTAEVAVTITYNEEVF